MQVPENAQSGANTREGYAGAPGMPGRPGANEDGEGARREGAVAQEGHQNQVTAQDPVPVRCIWALFENPTHKRLEVYPS